METRKPSGWLRKCYRAHYGTGGEEAAAWQIEVAYGGPTGELRAPRADGYTLYASFKALA